MDKIIEIDPVSLVIYQESYITLGDFLKEWEKSHGLDKEKGYVIFNQGVIITHLYGLIVYPKEIFHKEILEVELKNINKKQWGNY